MRHPPLGTVQLYADGTNVLIDVSVERSYITIGFGNTRVRTADPDEIEDLIELLQSAVDTARGEISS
jgi:hypothetical protein